MGPELTVLLCLHVNLDLFSALLICKELISASQLFIVSIFFYGDLLLMHSIFRHNRTIFRTIIIYGQMRSFNLKKTKHL